METDSWSGREIGGYQLGPLLGAGGMGAVYQAWHQATGRELAVKILSGNSLTREELRRFRRETQIQKDLRHPNLLGLFDAGSVDGHPYLVLELIRGTNLKDRLKWKPQTPLAEVFSIGLEVAKGLAFLHEQQIAHRDLKPANVLLAEDGRVLICDFGLARAPDSTLITRASVVLGTLQYMAPEVLSGEGATLAVDCYALGLVLYQLATGTLPFSDECPVSPVYRVISEQPVPPSLLNKAVPPELNTLILGLLAKQPTERLTAAQAVERLEAGAAPDIPSGTRRPIPLPRVSAPDRNPWPRFLLVLALGAAALWAYRWVPSPVRFPRPTGPVSPPALADLLRSYTNVRPVAELLTGPAETARPAVVRLESTTGLKLGGDPLLWLYWLQLGQWLEGTAAAGPPPRYRRAQAGPMPSAQEELLHSEQLRDIKRAAPRLLGTLIWINATWPEDGRPWISLGWLIQSATGQLPRRLYDAGLKHPRPHNPRGSDAAYWPGLFSATLATGGSLANVKQLLQKSPDRVAALSGFVQACPAWPPYASVLEELGTDPARGAVATRALAEFQASKENLVQARKTCREGLARFPGDDGLCGFLVEDALAHGRLAQARQLDEMAHTPHRYRNIIELLEAGHVRHEPPQPGLFVTHTRVTLGGLLAARELDAAATLVWRAIESGEFTMSELGQLGLMLQEAGSGAQWLESFLWNALPSVDRPKATRYLSEPRSRRILKAFLNPERSGLWPADDTLGLRELCVLLADSLEGNAIAAGTAMERSLEHGWIRLGWMTVAEVLLRSGLAAPSTRKSPGGRRLTVPVEILIAKILERDFDNALPAARELADLYAADPSPWLVALFCAARTGSHETFMDLASRAVYAARYHGWDRSVTRDLARLQARSSAPR
jgi:serine/threonine protein kinase